LKDIALERREGRRRKEGTRKEIRRRGGRGINTGRETESGKRLRRRSSDLNLRLMR